MTPPLQLIKYQTFITMTLIDTHAHLYLKDFENDIDDVIQRAIENEVNKIILPNIDGSTISSMNQLCNKFPGHCFPLIGLHPTSVKNNYEDELAVISAEIEKNIYYGIGETGIDLYWDKTFAREQEKVFRYQLDLSVKRDLPIIIHARNSFEEIFLVMENYKGKNLKGIFHAFTGTLEQARHITEEYNFKLGIGGIVTFKNSGLDKVIEQIDLKHLVLETDSPFLAPVPHRGKRNESAYLKNTAEKIAYIKKIPLEELAKITTLNASEIFKLK